MKQCLYIGSHGLGEMVCQTPVIRRLSREFEITLVAPENLRLVFEGLPYIKEFISHEKAGFQATSGTSFRMAWKPKEPCSWFSGHFDTWQHGPGWPHISAPRIESATVPYAQAYMRHVFGDDGDADDYMMDVAPMRLVSCCSPVLVNVGSGEPNRRLDALSHARLIHAVESRWAGLGQLTCVLPTDNMQQMLRMVAGCEILITPDTGPLHVALAMGKKVIALESRESMEQVVHPYYHDKIIVWKRPDPDCDRDCRARAGISDKTDYPLCLRCWGKPVPCLELSDGVISSIMLHARILLSAPADKEPSSAPLQGGEF